MIACTSVGLVPNVGGISEASTHAEPAAGAGADENDAPALAQRLGDDFHALCDSLRSL